MNQDFWNDFHLYSIARSNGIQYAAEMRTNAMKHCLKTPSQITSYEVVMCVLELLHDYMIWTDIPENEGIAQNYIDTIVQCEEQYRKSLEDFL